MANDLIAKEQQNSAKSSMFLFFVVAGNRVVQFEHHSQMPNDVHSEFDEPPFAAIEVKISSLE